MARGGGGWGVEHGHMVGFLFKRNPLVCARIALWVCVGVGGGAGIMGLWGSVEALGISPEHVC